jgi:hypothetical protein
MWINLFSLLFLLSSSAMACEEWSRHFLPQTGKKIPVGNKSLGLTKTQFHQVIDKVEVIYSKKFKAEGKNLKIVPQWDDPDVNASAVKEGPFHVVNLFGGLARHPRISEDGFALVICHEMGHHIGGAPLKNQSSNGVTSEGQADYFATLKCLKEVFANDDNDKISRRMKIPDVVTVACRSVYKTSQEAALCQRISMAGKSVANLFADRMEQLPEFEYPSTWVVSESFDGYPSPQCRLDTYFQGALCDRPLEEKLSGTDPSVGTCHPRHRDQIGMRPLCWFKP